MVARCAWQCEQQSAIFLRSDQSHPFLHFYVQFKLALCQLSVGSDKQNNIEAARLAIEEASTAGAELIVLPEMWNCPYSNDSFPAYAEDTTSPIDAPSYSFMAEIARNQNIVLVGGSIPERVGTKLFNTCFVFGKSGRLLGRHRKTHLFDIDIPGKITFRESETLSPGESITVVDSELGRLAVGICYDIRFPELAALYASRGAQMIIYPGNFDNLGSFSSTKLEYSFGF